MVRSKYLLRNNSKIMGIHFTFTWIQSPSKTVKASFFKGTMPPDTNQKMEPSKRRYRTYINHPFPGSSFSFRGGVLSASNQHLISREKSHSKPTTIVSGPVETDRPHQQSAPSVAHDPIDVRPSNHHPSNLQSLVNVCKLGDQSC